MAFREPERLARFAATAGRAPHVWLGYISWELSEDTARRVTDEQTAAAVVEAIRRAQVMATAAGAGEVRVVEVSDPGLLTGDWAPQPEAMAARSSKGPYGGDENLDPEFLEMVPRPVRTSVSVNLSAEA